ncbi:hypothetical protein NPIL_419971 [Nephila pilipes]|uniref:Uncharacterized protein n=1 Tax=Nephila pilipes TaxID=299642 RepID=A0A8X6KLS9_NEPPI|nr:hypothetical protein NPIL_419971 [Nephila pilipes]
MTKRKNYSIIEDVKRIKFSKNKESSRDNRVIQRYDVLTVHGCEKLTKPLSDARNVLGPEIKRANGIPRRSHCQGSVEQANQDIENILATWII